jgi:hypothetical protein
MRESAARLLPFPRASSANLSRGFMVDFLQAHAPSSYTKYFS